MALTLITAPATEPLSLAEVKLHLRLDSGSLADDLVSAQSIAPGSHVIAAAYSLEGSGVDVLGYQAVAFLEAGACGAGGTVDVKFQESDDDVTYSDVSSGSFTQVTEANDNATYELAYTGTKQYLRAVATVAGAACSFGVSIVTSAPAGAEDTLLTNLITAARRHVENVLRRALITQTWELWLDDFPTSGFEIPLPPLQEPVVTAGAFVTGTTYRILSVGTTDFTAIGASANTVGVVFTATGAGSGTGTATASVIIRYYDTSDVEAAVDASTYFVDRKSEPSRANLAYGESWPTTTLRPTNGVSVTWIAGYGAASDVPEHIKSALLLLIGHLYEHREATAEKALSETPLAVRSLLTPERIWRF